MNAVLVLLLVGLLLVGFEVFVPGGVLGVLGGAAMFAGCGVAFYHFGATVGTLMTVGAIAVLAGMLWAEMVVLPKTRLGKKLLLHQAVDATSQPAVADAAVVVGRDCEAVTTLAPSGFVLLDGRRYEAWSQSGFVLKGATLHVVGIDNFRLIVTKP